MKQSIFQKLFLKNRLLAVTLAGAFCIWLVLQIPILGLGLYFSGESRDQASSNLIYEKEQSLFYTFQILSRFGDIVNSRQQIIEIGKPIGLKDFVICKNSSLLLASPLKSQCDAGKYIPLQVAGEDVEILFEWEKPQTGVTFDRSIMTLSAGSFLVIFLLVYLSYILFTSKIQNFALKILELQENPKAIDQAEIMTELKPVVGKIKELIEQNNRNNKFDQQNLKVDLARQLAHDIRAPLSALNILVSTLSDIPKEKMEIFQGSIERINRIAIDLLTENKKTAVLKSFDLVSSLDSLAKEKNLKHESNNAKISFQSVVKELQLTGVDKIKFERIISNLIENSVEAGDKNSDIAIRVLMEPKIVKIEVEDNGKGMSNSELQNIGKKGFTTKQFSDQSGSGLGVYSAMKDIDAWKGTLRFFSEVGKGTLVEIKLPCVV